MHGVVLHSFMKGLLSKTSVYLSNLALSDTIAEEDADGTERFLL